MTALFRDPKMQAPETNQSANRLRALTIDWLKRKAPESEFPVQYFLSWMLMDSDPDEALVWNARARVGAMLGIESCSSRQDPGIVWFMILEGRPFGETSNNMRVRGTPSRWAIAVNDAVEWNSESRTGIQLRKDWLCGANNLLSDDDSTPAREELRRLIVDRNREVLSGRKQTR